MVEDYHCSTVYDGEKKSKKQLNGHSSRMVNKLSYSHYNKNYPTISSYVFKEF